MNSNLRFYPLAFMACVATVFLMGGCTVKYSFSGASIHPDARTFSVAYFPNNSAMVAPILSSEFTEALKDRFLRQTKLSLVNEGGDLSFEGEITNYTTQPAAVSAAGNDSYASRNRLTIQVRVRFTNALEPQYNFDRSFSAYEEYDTTQSLQDVEPTLIPEIVDKLIEDIFNAAVSNW